MTEISRVELLIYLRRFVEDVQRFQAADLLPWAVARLFNELLKQTKLELGAHPLANTISSIKEHPDTEYNFGASAVTVGAVLAMAGQLVIALELEAEDDGAGSGDSAFELVEDDPR
jgi:hypothetical protein